MYKTITLSDGKPIKVRVLGLFELDGIQSPLGPYVYTMLTATGEILEDEYIFPDEPPTKPDVEQPEQGSYEYLQLQEYETYQAALAYEKKRTEDYERYLREINQYILNNCLSEDDQDRIVGLEDWSKIQTAVIIPQLTEEAIADTLRDTFQGIIW